MNLHVLTQPMIWFLVLGMLFGLLSIYTTGDVVLGLVPMTGMVAWLSVSGYIALWYFYTILLVVSILFTIRYLVPLVVSSGIGGSRNG